MGDHRRPRPPPGGFPAGFPGGRPVGRPRPDPVEGRGNRSVPLGRGRPEPAPAGRKGRSFPTVPGPRSPPFGRHGRLPASERGGRLATSRRQGRSEPLGRGGRPAPAPSGRHGRSFPVAPGPRSPPFDPLGGFGVFHRSPAPEGGLDGRKPVGGLLSRVGRSRGASGRGRRVWSLAPFLWFHRSCLRAWFLALRSSLNR